MKQESSNAKLSLFRKFDNLHINELNLQGNDLKLFFVAQLSEFYCADTFLEFEISYLIFVRSSAKESSETGEKMEMKYF